LYYNNTSMNLSLSPPVWVDTPHAVQTMLSDLGEQPAIAVDTESNSLHAYREQVCLIQFSTHTIDYLLDPLAIQDLSPLSGLFADPDVEKVFHAAEYDLICLKRDFGFEVANLFDTRWAVRILGYAGDGLDRVLREKFDVQSDKKYQKANWARRPLEAEQINYARLDTHYLLPLKDMLEVELGQHGFLELAREDFIRACHVHIPESRPALWERVGNGYRLDGRERTILKALYECRERIAERLDRPTFKVLSDRQLLDIAGRSVQHPDDLLGAGLSQKQVGNWGKELLGAVNQGREAPQVKLGPFKRPDEAFLYRLEALKQWRKKVAREMSVESDVVLPRSLMEKLAEAAPQKMNQLSELLAESPWRFGRFGPQILMALKG
jgi:ribonuclease D